MEFTKLTPNEDGSFTGTVIVEEERTLSREEVLNNYGILTETVNELEDDLAAIQEKLSDAKEQREVFRCVVEAEEVEAEIDYSQE